ncbi:conserved Plasmodium protein, unknown function [Plasmodium berghei]|uniref:Heptatricopeptide repeat-containing protein, putative n=2 Tax=Plasmodium berghei TaxID=5821 RepID=A0A509AII2_PLABA|nr:heptatricopeptide repeat-containing protein, putative [Plasmodium berghei ANKA]CXI31807.1 conserved Plasmodium protein, unknown function [Plasmodium berghei]SCM21050.1 conserved Plasmodium protein, unknown function [Plasmodium berghei]SCN24433.1 conserved Plasmodium protein, unknown function [Plasmodium berghei]SCO60809.1 conserved Plasmodium protein, unknown function [Plasmodium berghei]VUC55299.1 heptatricopeptide repeat-containing protein, putative [Plasmodium berghei ANKA]|eukprot:XP_034421112.1 heptatricopeptide repeat-containing protein, putative [Plasmodium berghei ANKA]
MFHIYLNESPKFWHPPINYIRNLTRINGDIKKKSKYVFHYNKYRSITHSNYNKNEAIGQERIDKTKKQCPPCFIFRKYNYICEGTNIKIWEKISLKKNINISSIKNLYILDSKGRKRASKKSNSHYIDNVKYEHNGNIFQQPSTLRKNKNRALKNIIKTKLEKKKKEERYKSIDDIKNGKENNIEKECSKDGVKFLNVLYRLIKISKKKKNIMNENIENGLNRRMVYFIKNEKDMRIIFLLLHTLNKLVCINNLIKHNLNDDIYKITDSELLSIVLRILVNSFYKDNKMLSNIMNKLKENIVLGTCTPLTISNTFYSYSILYKRNMIEFESMPLQEIIQIISNYYTCFSNIELCDILECFGIILASKKTKEIIYEQIDDNVRYDKLRETIKQDKIFHKNYSKLLLNVGNYLINNDIKKNVNFHNLIKLIYSYAKCKIYHENFFLYLYPTLVKNIKYYNEDIMRKKVFESYKINMNCNTNLDGDKKEDNVNIDKDKNSKFPSLYFLINNNEQNEIIMNMTKNVTYILYSYSKFNMHIDELNNEILLFLQNMYTYMDYTYLSQCLISLTKINCNINILLSKIHHSHFNVNSNYIYLFRNCTSIDLMNYLLSFSRNLYMKKDVYNILAELFINNNKIYTLGHTDLVNIIYAYSKIYYIHNKLFTIVDNILISRLDINQNYLSPQLAIKYINSCAKISYKNDNIIYKIVEIAHKNNFQNIQIFDLFKLLSSSKRLNLNFKTLENHIQMISPNFTLDSPTYQNFYYKASKDIHVRKKKWIW